MRLFLPTACAEGGGGGGTDVLHAPRGCVSFQMQLSFQQAWQMCFWGPGSSSCPCGGCLPCSIELCPTERGHSSSQSLPRFFSQVLLTYSHILSESLHLCTQLFLSLVPFSLYQPILSGAAISFPAPSNLFLFSSLSIGLYLSPPCLPIPWSHHAFLTPPVPAPPLSFSPFPPPSRPPSPKPAWQSLLQQSRLISIANTQRPPQTDINLHLSVMNISHLPQEGFIQHGRVRRGKQECGTAA